MGFFHFPPKLPPIFSNTYHLFPPAAKTFTNSPPNITHKVYETFELFSELFSSFFSFPGFMGVSEDSF
jgi:hypothetical protein